MPDICTDCGKPNSKPRYKGCPDCRARWRRAKQKGVKTTAKYKNRRIISNAASIYDEAPPDSLPCELGHAPGWYRLR